MCHPSPVSDKYHDCMKFIFLQAMYREIFGHSAFIGNIGFLQTHLISIGAKDSAIFQWKI